MAVRNLYRQARPFRYLGWGLFALALVALPSSLVSSLGLFAGLLLALGGAIGLDVAVWLSRRFIRDCSLDSQVIRLQQLELLVVPGVLWLLHYPLALQFAVLAALLNANVALGGTRALTQALGVAFVSLLLGWCLGAPPLVPKPEDGIWLAGATLLLIFTTALADVGFRLTQKLDDHRSQWQERLAVLQPFVPHALTDQAPEQQRRFITVVMLDLVEFTAKSSPLPPEVIGTVLDDLLDAVVNGANATGGTLDKFMGDGALLFFSGGDKPRPNLPNSQTSARRLAVRGALRFSCDLLSEMPELNSRWQSCGLPAALELRIGITSGYCSLGQWGRSDVRAYTMVGACVGLAERLQSVSAPGSLALCPVSARLLLDDQRSDMPPEFDMPDSFKLLIDGVEVKLQSSEHLLKGFAQMRVYRPSDKVHAPTARVDYTR